MPKRSVSPKGIRLADRMIDDFFAGRGDLASCREDFGKAFQLILDCFRNDHTLFLCGNGGSFADCLHIGGELAKSFERPRPLPAAHRDALRRSPLGRRLAGELQAGCRAIPLGLNGSLLSAIWNDSKQPNIHFAQELYVMGRKGDMLLAISTSGNARNVLYALAVARTIGLRSIGLTGPRGGVLASECDVALRLPGRTTREIQESHQPVYHLLCLAIEAAFFPG